MNSLLYITIKYWAKHKKSAVAFIFSSILMMVVVVVAFLQIRTNFNRELHKQYDNLGMYDLMLADVSDEFLNKITDGVMVRKTSFIYALGKTGMHGTQFTYGYIDDDAELAHIPFESGRMPFQEKEAAIARKVLDKLNWVGKVGDSIVLDNGTFTVVGIIDEAYCARIGSEINIDAQNGDISPNPIPLIFIGKPDSMPVIEYQIVMLDGIVDGIENKSKTVLGMQSDNFVEFIYTEFGENARWKAQINDKTSLAAMISQSNEFHQSIRFLIVMAGISGIIAVFSVFSVLRIIFAERKNNIRMLRRIGLSKNKIRLMYILECLFFIIVQTVIGFIIGVLGYLAIYKYQVNILNMTDYSAFTSDILVTENTRNPFIITGVFSALITVTAYVITAISNVIRRSDRISKKKAFSLFGNLSAIFRQRAVTTIQTISLTLIVFGVMLGYMYYTDSGKEAYIQFLRFSPLSSYEIGENGFDLEKDGIAEYYSVNPPRFGGIETFDTGTEIFITADSNYALGIYDDTANKFQNIISTGDLKQTFIISDEPNKYQNKVKFTADELKAFILEHSTPEYQNFFNDGELGTKNLYRTNTKLTNAETLESLIPYVTAGEIDINKLNDGSEIIMTLNQDSDAFKVGQVVEIGSVLSNGGYGISDIATRMVRIGAIAVVPSDVDKFLLYATRNDDAYNFLTTVSGADSMGLHNASYTEVFAKQEIDGGLIPSSSGMKLTSYKQIKQDNFLAKAAEYGGMTLFIVLMSLLGFSAYFSGIDMKIRMKSYQISVLRAVGSSVSRIRRRMFFDNLKIPVISGAVAVLLVKLVQRITENGYDKLTKLYAPDSNGMISMPDDMAVKSQEIISKYFLDNKLWVVPVEKPLFIVIVLMCIVTIIITLLALRRFKGNIADTLNKGRERQ